MRNVLKTTGILVSGAAACVVARMLTLTLAPGLQSLVAWIVR